MVLNMYIEHANYVYIYHENMSINMYIYKEHYNIVKWYVDK